MIERSPFFNAPSPLAVAVRFCCPRCGSGALFAGFLTFRDRCSACDQDFSQIDAGDGPAVFVILLAGFCLVAAALYVEVHFKPAYWVHAVLWLPSGILLPLALLRPMKAWLAAKQFQKNAALGQLDCDD